MRKRSSITFFALSLIFLSVTVVFYQNSGTSLAKYLIFVINGFAAGVWFARGIISLKK